jgi:GGDEF domain-containing protein
VRHEGPPLTLSVGFATFPGDGETAETLLLRADAEMYEDKRQHKAQRQAPLQLAG